MLGRTCGDQNGSVRPLSFSPQHHPARFDAKAVADGVGSRLKQQGSPVTTGVGSAGGHRIEGGLDAGAVISFCGRQTLHDGHAGQGDATAAVPCKRKVRQDVVGRVVSLGRIEPVRQGVAFVEHGQGLAHPVDRLALALRARVARGVGVGVHVSVCVGVHICVYVGVYVGRDAAVPALDGDLGCVRCIGTRRTGQAEHEPQTHAR